VPARIRALSFIGAITMVGSAATITRGRAAAAIAPPLSGQLNLHNNTWDAVQVEVRIGSTQNCDANDVLGVRTLRRGNVWVVVADRGVCWRREANPGDGTGRWAPWASRPLLVLVEDLSL
jgi:hypothetical protein